MRYTDIFILYVCFCCSLASCHISNFIKCLWCEERKKNNSDGIARIDDKTEFLLSFEPLASSKWQAERPNSLNKNPCRIKFAIMLLRLYIHSQKMRHDSCITGDDHFIQLIPRWCNFTLLPPSPSRAVVVFILISFWHTVLSFRVTFARFSDLDAIIMLHKLKRNNKTELH